MPRPGGRTQPGLTEAGYNFFNLASSFLNQRPVAAHSGRVLRPAVHAVALIALTAALVGDEFPAPAPATAKPAGAPHGDRSAEVTIEPAKTSIYVGTVSLAMTALTRHDDAYTSDYTAKVFPFFFYSEKGSISIEFSDDQLRQLRSGETVDFKGHARKSSGTPRRIEGRAVPDSSDPNRGKIKVRVGVSKRIELVFNTVYRFSGPQ
jgi:hypothetical protein